MSRIMVQGSLPGRRSWTWTRSSTALKPRSSVSPSVMPGLTPPPASHIGEGVGVVVAAVVAAASTIGVRPNSPPQMTSVSSSRPRCFRSLTSAAMAWSVSLQHFFEVLDQVAVLVPGLVEELHEAHAALDQPAGQQAVVGERRLARLGAVQVERLRFGSFERSISSGALVCMRKAISYGGDARGDLRVADDVQRIAVELARSRRASRAAAGGRCRRGSRGRGPGRRCAERHALVDGRQEAAAPVRVAAAGPLLPVLKTTKPGRSFDSLPRP